LSLQLWVSKILAPLAEAGGSTYVLISALADNAHGP